MRRAICIGPARPFNVTIAERRLDPPHHVHAAHAGCSLCMSCCMLHICSCCTAAVSLSGALLYVARSTLLRVQVLRILRPYRCMPSCCCCCYLQELQIYEGQSDRPIGQVRA